MFDRSVIESPLQAARSAPHLPGDPLIWLFVIGDMIVFTLFFCVFGYFRARDTAVYVASQEALSVHYGAFNSLILLLSSWFMVMCLSAARRGDGRMTARMLGAAFLCGLAFSVAKVLEYRGKLAAGFDLQTNDFFTFYYLLTGLHFAHLLCGLGVLAWLIVPMLRHAPTPADVNNLESTAVYWHMVDLLWIVIFTMLYLLP